MKTLNDLRVPENYYDISGEEHQYILKIIDGIIANYGIPEDLVYRQTFTYTDKNIHLSRHGANETVLIKLFPNEKDGAVFTFFSGRFGNVWKIISIGVSDLQMNGLQISYDLALFLINKHFNLKLTKVSFTDGSYVIRTQRDAEYCSQEDDFKCIEAELY